MNLASIIERHPADAPALVSRGQVTSYGDLRARVAETRRALEQCGLRPGERVAIIAANTPFFVASYLGILGAGGVAVPLNPTSPAAELERELRVVRTRIALAGPSARDALRVVDRARIGLEHVLAAAGAGIDDSTPIESLGGERPASDRAPAIVPRDRDDLAVFIFTAGTGGSPKAAMLSHGNLLANLEQVQRHPGRAVRADDVSFGVLPLFHIFGLNVVLGLALYSGSQVVLVERFDPVSALETIRDHRVTIVAGAPPMFAALAATPGYDDAMASVRLAVSGASALGEETQRAFESRFGVVVNQGYGLTEASPIVTSSVVGGAAKPGSIGAPLPGVEVRLVDEEGEDALVGDAGEIWVRGPNVFKGYFEEPEATARALAADGWLRTGDVAVADDDGYLFIIDRAKDLIIVSGFNVYPAEVEEVLATMPGIEQVGVAGVPHPHSGETVKAWVVAAPGAVLEEDAIIEYCASRLARYKCPTKVRFVDELPRGLGGKLLRRALDDAALA